MAVLLAGVLLFKPVQVFFFSDPGDLSIVYPFDGSLFPPEIIEPTVWWEHGESDATVWRVSVEFESGAEPVRVEVDTTFWVPDPQLWEAIKRETSSAPGRLAVEGLVRFAGFEKPLSSHTISLATSSDSVGAPIYYRDVPLPFISAVENISTIKWRLGNVGSHETPPVVLSDLPVCGNCHSFSADGTRLGMDVDVANDKGAYVLTDFSEETIFARASIFSWYDYFDAGKSPPTFGLLARVSPSGKYVVGGLADRAVFLARSDLAYSQIFFPVQGVLGFFDSGGGEIRTLPGADDPGYVQANGTWTPDSQHVTFARAPAPTLTTTPRQANVSLTIQESAELLGGMQYVDETKEGYNKFRYDLYTVPFNGGKGGEPVPVKGASHNGMSNYFPKYSPDGKWLVFNKAESFMLLMPDSRLYIMPAEGGEPRLMNCNTESMNSWHSWSPNSRWLVFSSKLFSPYTQLFLTHIDEDGNDTPPILLKNFLIPERAANIPEFVNIEPDAERIIRERFIDDYNYLRRGRRLEEFGKTEDARDQYLEALTLNPQNTEARLALGLSYAVRGEFPEAERELNTILEHDPRHARALYALGGILADQGEHAAAAEQYETALEGGPHEAYFEANVHLNLGRCLRELGEYERAIGELRQALRLDPENLDAHIHLGNTHIRLGDVASAIAEFEEALEIDPSLESLKEKVEELRLILTS